MVIMVAAIDKTSDIPRFDLEEGLNELISQIRKKLDETVGPVIVEVGGGSASGKTVAVSQRIKEYFGEDAIIFPMDDYYHGNGFMRENADKGVFLNWDQPEALNLEYLHEHLTLLKQNKAINKPIYSMKYSETIGHEILKPSRLIILEGIFALNDIIKDQGDIKVFVEIGTHGRLLRRLIRDIERTGKNPSEILKYFAEVVEPMHKKYVEGSKTNADIIIVNEYCADKEAAKLEYFEEQLKFKADGIKPAMIMEIGAEELFSTQQTDEYFSPSDRDIKETDELIMIRKENVDLFVNYKAARKNSDKKKRPVFSFKIDKDIEQRFLELYGDKVKIIKKNSVMYSYRDMKFSFDKVTKEESGKITDLGNFISILSPNKPIDEVIAGELLSKLDLSFNDSLTKSYFEL
jgi:uridine kinase